MRIKYYYILILMCVVSCVSQHKFVNASAEKFVNEIMFTDDIVSIYKRYSFVEEINQPNYTNYKNLEKNGYVKLKLIDTSRNNKTYKIELLAKSDIFIKGTTRSNNDEIESVILKTVAHGAIEIKDVIPIDDYYKINYKIINPKRTPFHEDYYIKSQKPLESYEGSCYVKYLNDRWQVHTDTMFYDFTKYGKK
ncbi:hypothetical protein [uncultured Kordia sp.]|uniref:hypothetical protein n=1 Tax=uncultured Kordia sp. TaxID=507699 RepID=UPI00260481B7|nr:hypothetical protein [uncultured Kordia sp.]